MQPIKQDYYEVLGINKNATDDEIRNAYRKKALLHHPDRQLNKSDEEKKQAEDLFKQCAEAYSVLSDKDKRAQYDQFGFDGLNGNSGFSSGGFDPFEMFKSHFGGMGGFSSMFEDFGFSPFGHNRHHEHRNEPDFDSAEDGSDLQMEMSLTFKESLYGCVKDIDITLDEQCPECGGKGIEKGSIPEKCTHCNGTGHITHVQRNGFIVMQNVTVCSYCHGQGMSAKTCAKCNGNKRIPAKKSLSVRIPQGIADGQRVRVTGKGECGLKGGKDGDMYIRVHVEPSKLFKRDGNSLNLVTSVPVDAITATLGGQIDVRTPWETLKISVPMETTSGARMTLKGSGVHSKTGNGDLTVIFEVVPFENLSKEQKKMLENLKKTLKDSNVKGMISYKSKEI